MGVTVGSRFAGIGAPPGKVKPVATPPRNKANLRPGNKPWARRPGRLNRLLLKNRVFVVDAGARAYYGFVPVLVGSQANPAVGLKL